MNQLIEWLNGPVTKWLHEPATKGEAIALACLVALFYYVLSMLSANSMYVKK